MYINISILKCWRKSKMHLCVWKYSVSLGTLRPPCVAWQSRAGWWRWAGEGLPALSDSTRRTGSARARGLCWSTVHPSGPRPVREMLRSHFTAQPRTNNNSGISYLFPMGRVAFWFSQTILEREVRLNQNSKVLRCKNPKKKAKRTWNAYWVRHYERSFFLYFFFLHSMDFNISSLLGLIFNNWTLCC